MNREGWICPNCRMAHAPWVPNCDCHTRSTGINVTELRTTPGVKAPGATNNDDAPGYVKPTLTSGEEQE